MAENLTQLQLLENAYIKKMQPLIDSGDTEEAHGEADDLLIEFLNQIGCKKLADAYNDVPKWYS